MALHGIRYYDHLVETTPGCVRLTLGEPQCSTPASIQEACKTALDSGLTHYAPAQGLMALRRAIAAFERTRRGLDYAPEEILITAGATEGISLAIGYALRQGGEAVIPTPAYPLYADAVRSSGGAAVLVDTSATGFLPTPDALRAVMTEQTRLLIINSPHNPTGVVYPPALLREIAALAREQDILLLSDDVYWGLGPCATLTAVPGIKDRLLAVQSFSKPYAMTGWRVGYLMAPEERILDLTACHSRTLACCPTMLQAACIPALGWDTAPLIEQYAAARDFAHSRLTAMGLPTVYPGGAFYLFPSVAHAAADDAIFCEELIRRAGVGAVPGSVFGAPGYIRLSCCCDEPTLAKGLDRLERMLLCG